MKILDYILVFLVLFLTLLAVKSLIKEKGTCAYCANKEKCRIHKIKEKKNHTKQAKCSKK